MPDLAMLPGGMSVFVDTNIFHFHFQNKSPSCTAFLNRIAVGDDIAFVNTQVLSDLLHKLMLAEGCQKQCTRKPSAFELKQYFKGNRNVANPLKDYQTQFENIIAIGLHILPINEHLLVDTKVERQQYYLMTGDSLHLGTMNRRKAPLQDIVTYDADFDLIPGLTVWKPSDVT